MNFAFPYYGSSAYDHNDLASIRINSIPLSPGFGSYVAYLAILCIFAVAVLAMPGIVHLTHRAGKCGSPMACNTCGISVGLVTVVIAGLLSACCAAAQFDAFAAVSQKRMNNAIYEDFERQMRTQPQTEMLELMEQDFSAVYDVYAGLVRNAFEHTVPLPIEIKILNAAAQDLQIVKDSKPLYFVDLPDSVGNELFIAISQMSRLFEGTFYQTLQRLADLGIDVFGQDLQLFNPQSANDETLRILTFPSDIKRQFRTSKFARDLTQYIKHIDTVKQEVALLRSHNAKTLSQFNKYKVQRDLVTELPATILARQALSNEAPLKYAFAAILLCATASMALLAFFVLKPRPVVSWLAPAFAGVFAICSVIGVIYHFEYHKLTHFHLAALRAPFDLWATYFGKSELDVDLAEKILQFEPSALHLPLESSADFVQAVKTRFSLNHELSFYNGTGASIVLSGVISSVKAPEMSEDVPLHSFFTFEGKQLPQFLNENAFPAVRAAFRANRLFGVSDNLQRLQRIYDARVGYSAAGSAPECSNFKPRAALTTLLAGLTNASIELGPGRSAGLSDLLTLRFANCTQYILLESLLTSISFNISAVKSLAQHYLIYLGAAAFAAYFEDTLPRASVLAELDRALDEKILEQTAPFNTTFFGLSAAQLDAFATGVNTAQFHIKFVAEFGPNPEYYQRVKNAFEFVSRDAPETPFTKRFQNAFEALKFAARFQRADVLAARIQNDPQFAQIDAYTNNVCMDARYNIFNIKRKLENQQTTTRFWQRAEQFVTAVFQVMQEMSTKHVRDIAASFINARKLAEGACGFAIATLVVDTVVLCIFGLLVPKIERQEKEQATSNTQLAVSIAEQNEGVIMQQREMLLRQVIQ